MCGIRWQHHTHVPLRQQQLGNGLGGDAVVEGEGKVGKIAWFDVGECFFVAVIPKTPRGWGVG